MRKTLTTLRRNEMKSIKFVAVGLLTLSLVAVAISTFTRPSRSSAAESSPQAIGTPTVTPAPSGAPIHARLGVLFRHINKIADDESVRRDYQRRTRLSDAQFFQLVEIARDHEREVETLDLRAKQIIQNVRAAYPPGRLPPGVSPPQPPQELLDLQDQRNEAAVRHQARLRQRLGTSGFDVFITFLDSEFRPKARSNSETIPVPTPHDSEVLR